MARKALLRNVSDADLRLLRVFRTVADCGGLAASEFELNIGKSTISKHIADLETRLNLTLCHRGPSGFSLTSEGAEVLKAAERLMSAIDVFQGEIDSIHQSLTGFFRIAMCDHAASNPVAHVDEAIKRFGERAPSVSLDISMAPPNVIETGVLEGRFDLGLAPHHRLSNALNYLDLYAEEMILYCGRGHPLFESGGQNVNVEDLRRFAYAGFDFNSPNMVVGQRLGLKRVAHARDEQVLAILIKSGRYIGFLPSHMAQPFVARGQLKEVLKDQTRYRSVTAAITRKTSDANRKLTEFLKCLSDAHPPELKGAR